MAGYGVGDFFNEYILRRRNAPNALATPVTEEEAWANYQRQLAEEEMRQEMERQAAMQAQRRGANPQAFDHLRNRQHYQQMVGSYE